MLELETINAYWAADPSLTVDGARRPPAAAARDPAPSACSWAGASAAPSPRRSPPAGVAARVVVLDGLAPGAPQPSRAEAELLRSFAMYAGARRGRPLAIDPARLRAGLEPALAHILEAARAAGALRVDTTPATVRRCYEQHARARPARPPR